MIVTFLLITILGMFRRRLGGGGREEDFVVDVNVDVVVRSSFFGVYVKDGTILDVDQRDGCDDGPFS